MLNLMDSKSLCKTLARIILKKVINGETKELGKQMIFQVRGQIQPKKEGGKGEISFEVK